MHWKITPSGQFMKALDPFPSGLLFGYSVYTSFRFPLAERWLKTHLQRLEQNAKSLNLAWDYPIDAIRQHIESVFHPEKPIFRLTLWANIDHYSNFYTDRPIPSRLLLSVRPSPTPAAKGIALQSQVYQRALPTIKLGALAEMIHFKRQANQTGFDDILLVNQQGYISEASTANIFFLENHRLFTPEPVRDHCLPGITRLQIMEVAKKLNLQLVTDQPIAHTNMPQMEGAFLSNAVQGILPIQRIDAFSLPWPTSAQELFTQLSHGLAKIR